MASKRLVSERRGPLHGNNKLPCKHNELFFILSLSFVDVFCRFMLMVDAFSMRLIIPLFSSSVCFGAAPLQLYRPPHHHILHLPNLGQTCHFGFFSLRSPLSSVPTMVLTSLPAFKPTSTSIFCRQLTRHVCLVAANLQQRFLLWPLSKSKTRWSLETALWLTWMDPAHPARLRLWMKLSWVLNICGTLGTAQTNSSSRILWHCRT